MKYVSAIAVVSALLGAACPLSLAAEDASAVLEVSSDGDNIVLSVPVSRLLVSFPRGDLVKAETPVSGATASPRYFQFVDKNKGLVVSGWFESASGWAGFDKFVVGEFRAMKKSGLVPKQAPEVVVSGQWQAYSYAIGLPGGTSANVRAELVSDGTWLDVHISVTSAGPASEAREQAVQFLKNIVVKEKS